MTEPIAYLYAGSEVESKRLSFPEDLDAEQIENCIPLIASLPKPEPVACAMANVHGTRWTQWYKGVPHGTKLYAAPPIDPDLLTIHRILQCVADCPPVEPVDSATLKAFKALCIETNRIGERVRGGLERDAARYRWLSEYLIGTRCDLDDAIISCTTKDEMDAVIDAALAAVKEQ